MSVRCLQRSSRLNWLLDLRVTGTACDELTPASARWHTVSCNLISLLWGWKDTKLWFFMIWMRRLPSLPWYHLVMSSQDRGTVTSPSHSHCYLRNTQTVLYCQIHLHSTAFMSMSHDMGEKFILWHFMGLTQLLLGKLWSECNGNVRDERDPSWSCVWLVTELAHKERCNKSALVWCVWRCLS